MEDSVFLDTGFVVARAVTADQYHEKAVALARQVEQAEAHIVTTRSVVIEIGNALAGPRYRATAMRHIEELETSPDATVVPVSEDLFRRAATLYRARRDKSWGLTDCISFVVMRERGLQEALAPDGDFEQAGFRALLRE
jgi:predicted nucleic acid-binding protein